MSFVNAFFKGVPIQLYRSSYDPDQLRTGMSSYKFEGKITGDVTQPGNRRVITLDEGAVLINTVSKQFAEAQQHKLESLNNKTSWAWIGTTIGSALTGYKGYTIETGRDRSKDSMPWFSVSAVLGVLALRSLYLVCVTGTEHDRWGDEKIRDFQGLRANVGTQGFWYARNNKLKNVLVTEEELKHLLCSQVDILDKEFTNARTPEDKIRALKLFDVKNPLREGIIQEVFSGYTIVDPKTSRIWENEEKIVKEVCPKARHLEQSIQSVFGKYKHEKSQIKSEAEKKIQETMVVAAAVRGSTSEIKKAAKNVIDTDKDSKLEKLKQNSGPNSNQSYERKKIENDSEQASTILGAAAGLIQVATLATEVVTTSSVQNDFKRKKEALKYERNKELEKLYPNAVELMNIYNDSRKKAAFFGEQRYS